VPEGEEGDRPPLESNMVETSTTAVDELKETEESDETLTRSKWGRVKRFQRGSGHITPKEGGSDVFVLYINIAARLLARPDTEWLTP
jgi:hypothetical protein